MKEKSFLPLGSIVRLKGGTRKLVIIGINQLATDKDNKNVAFDYCSCMYPYGYLNADELFMFNNENIEEIIFKGFEDDELTNYYEDVIWSINQNKGGNENG